MVGGVVGVERVERRRQVPIGRVPQPMLDRIQNVAFEGMEIALALVEHRDPFARAVVVGNDVDDAEVELDGEGDAYGRDARIYGIASAAIATGSLDVL